MGGMTDTAAETTTASVNGQAPGASAPQEDCEDCVSSGERVLAIVACLLGLFVVVIGVDMFTGGKLSGMVPVRGEQ
jgi:hypothetical protein